MGRGTSNIEVKRLNRNRVFRYINSREKTSMPDIVASLGMSGPTVLQMVKELSALHVVEEVGVFQSTGGRKAKAIATVKDFCYTVGIDITGNHISLVLINLGADIVTFRRIQRTFSYTEEYFAMLGETLEEFIGESGICREKIIGVGIAVPAIVDQAQLRITNSRVLNLQEVECESFFQGIPYPCMMMNDANAGAIAECMTNPETESMIYLCLSNSVGGAIVFQEAGGSDIGRSGSMLDNLYMGNHSRSAEFGHMVIHPYGERCYCGKQGCLDAYCSASRLSNLCGGNLEEFFRQMEAGNLEYRAIWQTYLSDLAIAVDNLRMCFDCDVVLGGYVGSFMEPYMEQFRRDIADKNIYECDGDYVRACTYKVEATALGAAICQMENYIASI